MHISPKISYMINLMSGMIGRLTWDLSCLKPPEKTHEYECKRHLRHTFKLDRSSSAKKIASKPLIIGHSGFEPLLHPSPLHYRLWCQL